MTRIGRICADFILVPTQSVGTYLGALRPSAQERRMSIPTQSVGTRSNR